VCVYVYRCPITGLAIKFTTSVARPT